MMKKNKFANFILVLSSIISLNSCAGIITHIGNGDSEIRETSVKIDKNLIQTDAIADLSYQEQVLKVFLKNKNTIQENYQDIHLVKNVLNQTWTISSAAATFSVSLGGTVFLLTSLPKPAENSNFFDLKNILLMLLVPSVITATDWFVANNYLGFYSKNGKTEQKISYDFIPLPTREINLQINEKSFSGITDDQGTMTIQSFLPEDYFPIKSMSLTIKESSQIINFSNEQIKETFLPYFSAEYEKALSLATGELRTAISALAKIRDFSPFYGQAREKMNQWQEIVKKKEKEKFEAFKLEYESILAGANYENYQESIEKMEKIKPESPFHKKAHSKIKEWTLILNKINKLNEEKNYQDYFNQAYQFFTQGKINEAIEELQKIPPASVWYEEARKITEEWSSRENPEKN